jgi:hypothetical protein
MRTVLKLIIIVLHLTSCGTNENLNQNITCDENIPKCEKWLLIQDSATSRAGFGFKSGYINEKGDTVVSLDRYLCYTDTFEYYAIVFDIESNNLIGINKAQKKLFNALFTTDGEPVHEGDGRLLIVSENKYGFVNHMGQIVIEPKYSCAESFLAGKARVSNECQKSNDGYSFWKSDNWITIDKCGNEISIEK